MVMKVWGNEYLHDSDGSSSGGYCQYKNGSHGDGDIIIGLGESSCIYRHCHALNTTLLP